MNEMIKVLHHIIFFCTIQGKCECSKDFIGYSCNVNKTAPPILTYLRDEGTCNTRGTTSWCRRVSVYGDTFVKSSELKCYAEAVMVSCLMLNVVYLNYYLWILVLYAYFMAVYFVYFYLLVEIANLHYYCILYVYEGCVCTLYLLTAYYL